MKNKLMIILLLLSCLSIGIVLFKIYNHNSKKTENFKISTSSDIKEKISTKSSNHFWEESTLESTAKQMKKLAIDDTKLQRAAAEVYYEVYFLDSGKSMSSDNSQATPSASVIKVFIMEYIYDLVSHQSISMTDIIDGETLEHLLKKMIQQSDNDATNNLINYFGMENMNRYFQIAGYSDTKLQRLMLDENARTQGLENYTSLNDCINYLMKLYESQNNPISKAMLEILKGQTIDTKIASRLPDGVEIANKTGELNTVENDMGIIFAEEPFILVVLSSGVLTSQQMREAIGEFTLEAFNEANANMEGN